MLHRFAAFMLFFAALTPIFAAEPLDLFQSANLDDWDFFLADETLQKSDVWEFRDDGILYCKGEPFGWLATKQEYHNFAFEIEYRWPEGAEPTNSGIFLRIAGEPATLPQCVECQLAAGKAGDLYGFGGRMITGSPERSKTGKYDAVTGNERNEKPACEWNTLQIVCQEGTVIVALNGRVVNWSLDTDKKPGKLGLQSEGGPIEFRAARLVELP